LIEIDRRFRSAYRLLYRHPGDGDSKFLNFGQFSQDYTAQHPRRRLSLIKIIILPISRGQRVAA
jgi:hypothetical protein